MHVFEIYLNYQTWRQSSESEIYYIIRAVDAAAQEKLWLGFAGRSFSNIHDSRQNQCLSVRGYPYLGYPGSIVRNHEQKRRPRRRRRKKEEEEDKKGEEKEEEEEER